MSVNETPLHRVAAHGSRADAEELIRNSPNIDINAKDDWGATPLHYSVSQMNVPLVELLLERGAHVNVRMRDGETPLKTAMVRLQRGHYVGFGDSQTPPQRIIDLLRQRGGAE